MGSMFNHMYKILVVSDWISPSGLLLHGIGTRSPAELSYIKEYTYDNEVSNIPKTDIKQF